MSKLMRCKLNKKGFTLIELMIVVAIIGILAAIAIPNFRNYQLKAKRGELPTNLKAIKTAEVAYQAENDVFQALANTPAGVPGTKKGAWQGGGINGFNNIGWQPSGDVYGSYYSNSADINAGINGHAISDIDGDGTNASYSFFVNITNPGRDYDVNQVTPGDVF